MRPFGWSSTTGIPRKRELERREYDILAEIVDLERFRQVLEEQLGPYQPTDHFPRDEDETDLGRSLADQFNWLHAYVLKEKATNASEQM